MVSFSSRSRWTTLLVAVGCVAGSHMALGASGSSRNLNPYHEQQLENQIRTCASGVMACSDAEQRSLKQQELCQLLIRAERFDEALQVAYNIYRSETKATERRAAYHFMVAEIHARKMKAAHTIDAMDASRRAALSAAQDVLSQKYPSKWGVSDYARELVRELNDSQEMARVRQRVASRQGKGDVTKEAIADAQRRYLDATQGRTASVENFGGASAQQPRYVRASPQQQHSEEMASAAVEAERGRTSNVRMGRRGREAAQDSGAGQAPIRMEQASASPLLQQQDKATVGRLPSEPQVTRVVSPMQRLSAGEQDAMNRLGASGLLTSQPGVTTAGSARGDIMQTTVETRRQPILVNGQPAQSGHATVDDVAQNNLTQLLEAAKRRKAAERRSPYATGQLPESR